MASGIAHQKSNRKLIKRVVIINGIMVLLVYLYFNIFIWQILIAAKLGLLFGYLYSPDMDHHVVTINEYELAVDIYNILKKLKVPYWIRNTIKQSIIKITVLYWAPYQHFIPHRDRLSHSYISSTLIRELYVFIPVIGLYMLIVWTISPLVFLFNYWYCIPVFIMYNCIIDANHLRLDKIKWRLY
ncbi:MAG: DUF2227 family putative metal-binding protein [Candidatus Riesia sp.]|nr:DUF2227 family putative metal-binding protein [Candidatus Riesia sp.]